MILKEEFLLIWIEFVENDPVFQAGVGIFKLKGNDLVKSALAVDMQVTRPSQQVHRKYNTHQAEVMIPVEVADKDVIDLGGPAPEALHLDLGGLTAIDQEMLISNGKKLGGMVPPICGRS